MKKLIIALLIFSSGSSFASLGSTPSNTGNTTLAARKSLVSSSSVPYTDIWKTLENGTVRHEYVDNNNVVFAVSWSGPYLPDLRETLGSHFDTLVEESKKRRGHPQIMINRSDVVINSGGHPGSFEGRAYIPGTMPAGFTPNDIK
jgi:hypothetical protein